MYAMCRAVFQDKRRINEHTKGSSMILYTVRCVSGKGVDLNKDPTCKVSCIVLLMAKLTFLRNL